MTLKLNFDSMHLLTSMHQSNSEMEIHSLLHHIEKVVDVWKTLLYYVKSAYFKEHLKQRLSDLNSLTLYKKQKNIFCAGIFPVNVTFYPDKNISVVWCLQFMSITFKQAVERLHR